MMRNLSVLAPIVSIFCLFFLSLLYHITLVASSTPRYVPSVAITLDCGSATSATSVDRYGRIWTGDFKSKFFPKEELNLKSNTSQAPKEGIEIKAPYTAARISYSQFTYVFPLPAGPKFVRLHFNPVISSGVDGSKAFFTVKSGSFTLLRNFTASVSADSLQIVKEFCINVEENQKLNLTFIPFSTTTINFYAFINGIEIVSMPDELYYSPKGASINPLYVGQSPPTFYIDYNMALEKIYRLNVGGSLIPPTEDTGMFREWSQDNEYFWSTAGGVIPHNSSLKPIYSKIKDYTAPDAVYRSAKSMGKNQNLNKQSNLTWELQVDSGFRYLVRLHFCEIDFNVNNSGERRFVIDIDYQLAEPFADVIGWAESRDTPIYKDYVVMIQKKGNEDNHILSIDLHPAADGTTYDAILNGVEVFKLSDQTGNLAGPSEMLPTPRDASTNKESKAKKTIFIAIGSGVGFLVVLSSVCCVVLLKLRKSKRYGSYYSLSKCWCWRDSYKGKSTRTKASSLPEELCRHFSIDEIRTATDNFHQELIIGRGGFGYVYKGFIDDGTVIVAIKRLNPESRQGAREFRTEIEMLSQLRHGHLVSLIGYCNDEGEMILVYEYMTNGTLSEHLFDTKNDPLTWKQRLEICLGSACGLHYLHTCMKNPIIHRDVKATNILLDDKWAAKVSDFGLSKMGLDQAAVTTIVKGTPGYLDPDYARRQQVTEKTDVYSFGVVLLEVLCGRKAVNTKLGQEQLHLASWARKCIGNGTIYEIIDPYLKGKIAPECFKVYVDIAENCVRDQGIQRPTMNDVMERLEFALELQQNADTEHEKINPNGDITYQEVRSFRVSGPAGAVAPGQNNFHNIGPVLESDTGNELSTNNSGMTIPSLDSESVTGATRDIFTDNPNTTT